MRIIIRKKGKTEYFYLQHSFRKDGKTYKYITEKILPDVLIEDDCESIGGEKEMTITNVSPSIKKEIKLIVVKEFSGIDGLPDNLYQLLKGK